MSSSDSLICFFNLFGMGQRICIFQYLWLAPLTIWHPYSLGFLRMQPLCLWYNYVYLMLFYYHSFLFALAPKKIYCRHFFSRWPLGIQIFKSLKFKTIGIALVWFPRNSTWCHSLTFFFCRDKQVYHFKVRDQNEFIYNWASTACRE